jgi:hypothetical protein
MEDNHDVVYHDNLRLGRGEYEPTHEEVEDLVHLRSYRFMNGLDLWTGEPLTGLERVEWALVYQQAKRKEA